MRFGRVWALIVLMVPLLGKADRLALNDKEVPHNLDDLRAIQEALQGNLERSRLATVCLQVGKGSGSGLVRFMKKSRS